MIEFYQFYFEFFYQFYFNIYRNDTNGYEYILESGQLHPKIVNEVIYFDNTIVVCLGLENYSVEDMVN